MDTPLVVLVLEAVLALGLTAGARLARRKRYRAHARLQASLVLVNLALIVVIMLPSLRRQFRAIASLSRIVWLHAAFGAMAELAALYIVLGAGTKWLTGPLALHNYKGWMRTTLVLWWISFACGAGVFHTLNGGAAKPLPPATTARVTIRNFVFEPMDLVVPAGTEVEWVDTGGRHSVVADDGSFQSPTLTAGTSFQRRFTEPGVHRYFCNFHGSAGGHDMAGTITVR